MNEVKITEEEKKISYEEGMFIYGYLRKKYCNENVKDLDIVLNSLCCALCRLIEMHVKQGEEPRLISLINNSLMSYFCEKK